MLVIKPIEDKAVQAHFVTLCGGKYIESDFAYLANEVEEDGKTVRFPIGVCQFSLKGDRGEFHDLRPCPGVEDEEGMMIMARAAMSFLFRCGIPTLIAVEGCADPMLLTKLGFVTDESGKYTFDLHKFYTSHHH